MSCTGYRAPPAPVARFSQQIANVYVSAYPEVPWADISAVLSPNLNMTIQQAQTAADSTTAAQSLLVSTVLSRGLAINFPTLSSTPSATAGGPPTLTSTPGTVPTAPGAPTLSPATASVAPPLSTLTPVDGSELLVTSTALFQQAAIIDNQINKQYLPYGYTGHLVTLQINVQPLRADWSYDVFVDITLIPSPWSAAIENSLTAHEAAGVLGPVVVKPLIITDALETSSVQQSIQEIQQALLQLSGSIGKGGAAGVFGSGSELQRGIAAYDKNSLVTAGRVNDATIRVRLGAAYSGTGRPALTPRSYNISLFVLTRTFNTTTELQSAAIKDTTLAEKLNNQVKQREAVTQSERSYADKSEAGPSKPEDDSERSPLIAELAVITHTSFLPSNFSNLRTEPTPEYVLEAKPFADRAKLADRVAQVVQQFYGENTTVHFGCTYRDYEHAQELSDKKEAKIEANLDLLRAVQRGDYQSIKNCLNLDNLEVTDEVKFNFFISGMSAVDETSHFTSLAIPLKDVTPVLPDREQLAIATDSADQAQQTVTFVGGKYLTADQLRAMAIVEFADGQHEWLLPSSMSFSNSIPSQLMLVFPNPEQLSPLPNPTTGGTPNSAAHGAKLLGVQMMLTHAGDAPRKSLWYPHIAKLTPVKAAGGPAQAPPSAPKNPISAAAQLCASNLKALSVATNTPDMAWSATLGPFAKVKVTVGELSKLSQTCAQTFGPQTTPTLVFPLNLAVSGADATPDGVCLTSSKDKFLVSAAGQCQGSLILTNFSEAVPITLTTTDSNGTSVGPVINLRILDTRNGRR
jgi:hypothetical protein